MITKNKTSRSLLVFLITFLLLVALPVTVALAADTGFSAPTTSANIGTGWANRANGYASDNAYTTAKNNSRTVTYAGFTFASIPGGSIINGLEISVEGFTSGRQANVSLSWNNGTTYTTGTGLKLTTLSGSEGTITLGGSTDKWGTGHTWIPSDFSGSPNTTFRVKLQANTTAGTISMDQVRVKVYYTPPTSLAVPAANGNYGDTVTLSATLTSAGSPVSGKTIAFTLNGSSIGSAVTNGSGIATLSGASLAGINAGSYPAGVGASFAGDASYQGSSGTAALTVNKRPITVTADSRSKTYGDADPSLTYSITSGSLVGGDSLIGGLTRATGEAVGSYAISQGTLAAGSNYNLTFVGADLTISVRTINVTAYAQSKPYGDADPALSYTHAPLFFSDSFSGALSRVGGEGVGTYAINQGTLSLSSNYNLVFTGADLTITTRSIEVTADARSKTYGEGDPDLTYSITSGSLVGGDSFSGGLSRDAGENVGSYAINQDTLTAGSNYDLTYVGANLMITTRSIEVTAATDSKTYDGTTSYSGTPSISSGTLVDGDTATWTQAFDNKNVGSGKTLTPMGSVSDGNGGNNYAVTFVTDTTGVITARAITVTAATDSKTYNGTTSSSGAPSISSGTLVGGDTATWTQAFDNKNVGSGKTLIPTGSVSDGNGGNNYAVTFVTDTTGVITTRAITVTAATDSKTYNGTTSSSCAPSISSGTLVGGDTATWTQAFDNKNVGSGKTLTPMGSVSDGNGGNNYAVTFVTDTTGVINNALISITANDAYKTQGDTLTFAGTEFTTSTLFDSDSVTSVTLTSDGAAPGASNGTYDIVPNAAIGVGLSNYDITYENGTLTVSVNTAATDISLSNAAINEALPAGTAIGTFTNNDPDGTDTFTYSLVHVGCAGTDNDSFKIIGEELQSKEEFDYEAKSSYDICMQVADNHEHTYQKAFTITVVNRLGAIVSLTSVGSYDGWILESASGSGIGGALNASGSTFPLGDNLANRQYRGILSFNTARLPDNAVITSVRLRMRWQSTAGDDPFDSLGSLWVDTRKPFFGAKLNLEKTDFKASADHAALASIPNDKDPSGWFSVDLPSSDYFDYINLTGSSQLRLRFATNSNSNSVADLMKFFSGNASLSSRPQLIIEYALPSASLKFNSVGSYDGWVLESAAGSGVGGTINNRSSTFSLGDDRANRQYRGILSFNTSTLPDNAIITSATLKIRRQSTVGSDPFGMLGSLLVDMRQLFFGGLLKLEKSDFDASADQEAVASIPNTPDIHGWYSVELPPGAFDSISTTGTTQLRLRFGTASNGNKIADQLTFFSGNASLTSRPQLIVEFNLP
jgi:hypothetical protein